MREDAARAPGLQAVKRKYAGITYDTTRERDPWKIQSNMGGGYFHDQDEAAKALARRQKTTVEALRLGKAQWLKQKLERQHRDFEQGMSIFHNRYPGDAEYVDKVASRSRQCAKAFQDFPGVIISFFIARFDDHRNDILSACDETRALLRSTKTVKDPVETLYKILALACRKASAHHWTDAWIHNVGKTNYHWMVLWIHMEKLNMLVAGLPSEVDRKGLIFTATKKKYYLQPLDNEIRRRLQSQVTFGEGCMAQAKAAPKTLEEYEKSFYAIDACMKPVHAAKK